ncbi:MAG: LysR family transcriptional regulator [Gammaproteobacteria bacterium]|nr:LysR family transcriptional regulator [Gammaproteobacteria bacterium]
MLGYLEAFIHATETGGFSAAAVRLGVSAAAVSKQIARLEARLGVRLFHRTTRSLTLTEAGEQLYESSTVHWRGLQAALNGISGPAQSPAGCLRVSVGNGFGRRKILPLMPEFLATYPAIRLDWNFENRQVDLVAEGFDAAIGSVIDPDSRVIARELMRVEVILCAAADYLARRGGLHSLADLVNHDCIQLRSPTTGRVQEWMLDPDRPTRTGGKSRVIVDDVEAVAEAVRLGLGIGLIGSYHLTEELATDRVVHLFPELKIPPVAISIYHRSGRQLAPKLRVFTDFLIERLRTQG